MRCLRKRIKSYSKDDRHGITVNEFRSQHNTVFIIVKIRSSYVKTDWLVLIVV